MNYASRRTIVVLSIVVICTLQGALSAALVEHVYFNDDHEQAARAAAFDDLYVRQFSVHMPVPAIATKALLAPLGVSHATNRVVAALINVLLLLAIYRITWVFTRGSPWAATLACLCWIFFEPDLWAFLNLADLHSAAFLYTGLAVALEAQTEARGVYLVRPLMTGVCLALACLSRILMGEQLIILAIALPLLNAKPMLGWVRYLCRLLVGGSVATICVVAVFFDRLDALFYWTLAHNFRAKSGNGLNVTGWWGHLEDPFVQNMLWRTGAMLALSLAILTLLPSVERWTRRSALLWFITFAGGWLAANPSGISDRFMHAIPAFPALCILLGIAAWHLVTTALVPASGRAAVAAIAVLLLVLVSRQAYARLSVDITGHDARHALNRTAELARFIRDHSLDNDTIFVVGTDPLLYVESGRRSATMASILYGDLAKYENRILSELEAAYPAAVVFDKQDFWFRTNIVTFPLLMEFIAANYEQSEMDGVLIRRASSLGHTVPKSAFLDEAFGIRRACENGHEVIRYSGLPALLKFSMETGWAEVTLPTNLSAGSDFSVQVTSSDRFGGVFDTPTARLRLLIKDRKGHMSWYWFGASDLLNQNSALVARHSFNKGEALDPSDKIALIQVGGWSTKGTSAWITDVSVIEDDGGVACALPH